MALLRFRFGMIGAGLIERRGVGCGRICLFFFGWDRKAFCAA